MNEQIINDQTMNEQIKKPKKISDLYKAGAILTLILGCFGSLGAFIYVLITIPTIITVAATPNLDPLITSYKVSTILTFSFLSIAFIPYIILAILSIKSLKEKTYKYRIVMSILSIMFGLLLGIIAGVLMLVAERDDNN
ncbi:hypothetical protein [Mycoplasma yeatsii]|uniref:hypothetical protein n=1 Tax=Mycoplasma yeatsii TaxID=51365 RepID=UPI0005B249B7|nr:hypothetical protein [Mycoplasma yeatsii]AJM71696.1 membrane protein [Mycoplasma yeatsii GM274B]